MAYKELLNTMISLRVYAEKHGMYEVKKLEGEALHLLRIAQDQLQNLIERNVSLNETETSGSVF